MDFEKVHRLAVLLSKSFAQDILKLLVNYQDISASEAATRLDLHIKTAQDFLEELAALGLCQKKEVYEKKRPYYRYKLKKYRFSMEVDLSVLADSYSKTDKRLLMKIRERKNNQAVFTLGRSGDYISSIVVFIGEGRKKKERRINLTQAQGKFLFYLPFPTARPMAVKEIIEKSGISQDHLSEILDLIKVLQDFQVIKNID